MAVKIFVYAYLSVGLSLLITCIYGISMKIKQDRDLTNYCKTVEHEDYRCQKILIGR